MKLLRRLFGLAALAFPAAAFAHPGHDGHDFGWDFSTGALHPLTGWDHLLAMVAVGLWAAQMGGRARWWVPASFAGMMVLGAVLGTTGLRVPGVEQGIVASVFVLGLLIAAAARLPVLACMVLVAAFAFLHGVAHGAELPASTGGVSYGAGFLVVTLALHATGLGLGVFFAHTSTRATQAAGWAIAAAGLLLAC